MNVLRLLKHITTNESSEVYADDMYSKYAAEHENSLSIQTFKTYVSQVFGVKSRVTSKGRAYRGLHFTPSEELDSVGDASNTRTLPPDIFLVSDVNGRQEYGQKTGIFVNDTEVMKEITVVKDGGLIHIFGKYFRMVQSSSKIL